MKKERSFEGTSVIVASTRVRSRPNRSLKASSFLAMMMNMRPIKSGQTWPTHHNPGINKKWHPETSVSFSVGCSYNVILCATAG